jgi:hypothetical protein
MKTRPRARRGVRIDWSTEVTFIRGSMSIRGAQHRVDANPASMVIIQLGRRIFRIYTPEEFYRISDAGWRAGYYGRLRDVMRGFFYFPKMGQEVTVLKAGEPIDGERLMAYDPNRVLLLVTERGVPKAIGRLVRQAGPAPSGGSARKPTRTRADKTISEATGRTRYREIAQFEATSPAPEQILQAEPPSPRQDAPPTDEGSAPVRYPSIGADTALLPGETVVVVIDLAFKPSNHTMGGALSLGQQAANWASIPLDVTVVSSGIGFRNGGRGKIVVERNHASVSARITGTVHRRLVAGDAVDVHVQFWSGTRSCGAARRRFEVGPARPRASDPTEGAMRLPLGAAQPDLTVHIAMVDRSAPGKLHWRFITPHFDDLPPKLSGIINLGSDPLAHATSLIAQLGMLAPTQHKPAFEGIGDMLWERAPAEFRTLYWALNDHYKRPLTIQLNSDDPYVPWEFMRPSRDGETQPPLALRHAVARWISDYQGYMRPDLPAGDMLVFAPRYKSFATARPKAELAARQLVDDYGAVAVPATRKDLLEVLAMRRDAPVSLLYFSGHGAMQPLSAASAAIDLENGERLLALEVNRQETTLGKQFGSAVFFNACEVGATASSLGAVGGWATAFSARRFRAFIAPLWAVDEKEAAVVAHKLLHKILREGMTVAEALRDIRVECGDDSPTYYSYMLYGDVQARFQN